MDDLVSVKIFNSTGEAEAAHGLLTVEGIEAIIESSESGGMTPGVAGADTKLLVRAEDLEKARSILEIGE